MLDYTNKELIRTYHFNTTKEDRYFTKREVINGRTYDKHGVATVVSVIVDLWKVYDPSVKRSKYVYIGGVSRQHPNDTAVDIEMGYEVAHANAFSNPSFKFEYDEPVETVQVLDMMRLYTYGLPIEFIRTREEIELLNKTK